VDLQKIAELLIAGGMAGLIGAVAVAWKTRHDAARDDRKQHSEEASSAASVAKTFTDAAASIVKLQDEQVDEFRQQIRALQAESSALNTRLDKEIQKRMRAEAQTGSIEQQVSILRDQLATMRAQAEMMDQNRIMLLRENGAMKTKLFEMSVGIAALMRQTQEAGLEPAYVLEVPVDEMRTQPLGELRM
jgi:predicted RNase H-like nuclease (RuvC/YqgF family)